ncbi:MAG: enoyl-CoA hydratase-related protein [Proteobacteria bacterium]|nr:enoyl-CoA hydratase-related protein [Pseudomonadota bacterium]
MLPTPDDFVHTLFEVRDHIATVTLNRPEIYNALNHRAYDELESVFRIAHEDSEIRCVILTGADPGFCSGDDVRAIMAGSEREGSVSRLNQVKPLPTPAASAILECLTPIVAAVNGAAVGWGMDLSLMCDIRVASEEAKFGELFVKRGLITDLGGLTRLPLVVGVQKASELLFTGDVIDAAEAERIGLVLKTVPHDDLMDTALGYARKIANNPPLAVQHLKEGLRKTTYGDHREIGSWIAHTLGILFDTEDHKEGVASFLEKRDATFTGR